MHAGGNAGGASGGAGAGGSAGGVVSCYALPCHPWSSLVDTGHWTLVLETTWLSHTTSQAGSTL